MITQYLTGHPGCIDTMKALVTAAEKGVDLEVTVVNVHKKENEQPEYLQKVPTAAVPYLRDADLIVYTAAGIVSYLDDKGFGPSLSPRNAIARARMLQWIDIGYQYVHPYAQALIEEHAYGGAGNVSIADKRREAGVALDALEKYLSMDRVEGEARFTPRDTAHSTVYIVGLLSQADMHWAPYIHVFYATGVGDMVDARPKVKTWFDEHLKNHKSKASIINTLTVLPSIEDMKSGKFAKAFYQNG
ncbi:MAG: glutathione S-transferase family protein [Burkholderiales bacterium]